MIRKERGEGNLPLTELPTPYEGVTHEILRDLLVNRGEFIRTTLETMERENPTLAEITIKTCIFSPDWEKSLDWVLAYYAIYSRSAARSGSPMLKVSPERSQASTSEEIRDLKQLRTEENIPTYWREKDSAFEEIINKEAARSEELSYFWATVKIFQFSSIFAGRKQKEIDYIFEPLKMIVSLLHSQEEVNGLKKIFKGI